MSAIPPHTFKSIADVQNLTYDEADEYKQQQQVKIKVSGFTYKVSYDPAADAFGVERSRTCWQKFVTLFKGGRNEAQSIQSSLFTANRNRPSILVLPLLRVVQNTDSTDSGSSSNGSSDVESIGHTVDPPSSPVRIGAYGFCEKRQDVCLAIDADPAFSASVKIEMIDQYNHCLGMTDHLSESEYLTVIEHAEQGTLEALIKKDKVRELAAHPYGTTATQHQIDEQLVRVKAWCRMLEQNVSKLNVRRLLEGKTKARQSIRKNVSPHFLADKFTPEQVKTAILALLDGTYVAPKLKKNKRMDFLKGAAMDFIKTALFRQTSKIGLQFFNRNKESVVFAWMHTDRSDVTADFLDTKPWKSRQGDGTRQNGYNEAITYSEMRKVLRMKKPGEDDAGRVIMTRLDSRKMVTLKQGDDL